MKSTGIVRRIDDLGRVVIPKEIRRTMNLEEDDPMEIYVDTDTVILRKYEPADACIFCKNVTDVVNFKGKSICKECLSDLRGVL